MEEILLHLPYFGPVSHFREIVRPAVIWFENEDNYQKQTYRNRTYIYGANGKLILNIPIKHINAPGVKQHQKYKDVKIENDFKWQKQHWKSLKSAYQTSPFFEFYEDDIAPLFHKEERFLMEFNYKCFQIKKTVIVLTYLNRLFRVLNVKECILNSHLDEFFNIGCGNSEKPYI